jgi:hypothetical protein
MKLASIFREVGGDFLAHKDVFQMGNLQGSGYRIVVRNRYKAHASLTGQPVDVHGLGVALGAADFSQQPFRGSLGMRRVNMKIRF